MKTRSGRVKLVFTLFKNGSIVALELALCRAKLFHVSVVSSQALLDNDLFWQVPGLVSSRERAVLIQCEIGQAETAKRAALFLR